VIVLRRDSAEAENQRQLTPTQLEIIHSQQWLKILLPKKYSGLELSIPEILRIEEALAWVDGSTGGW